MNREIQTIISDTIQKLKLIHSEDIPNIDLYMDQVTTFMNSQLGQMKRNPEDKILTKTMINNYAKNDLLPSPEKKKYTKEHVIMLSFIYYFKGILSIGDISALMDSLKKNYFNSKEGMNLTEVYDEVASTRESLHSELVEDLKEKYTASLETFSQISNEDERDYLQLFSLICMLSFDVYTKKQIIENLIDNIQSHSATDEKDKKKKQ